MNGAEFKTMREACGLTIDDIMRLGHVKNRTVRYWENGAFKVPEDVSNVVNDLAIMQLRQSDKIYWNLVHRESKFPIVLKRFHTKEQLWLLFPEYRGMSTACHAAILYRAMKRLRNAGLTVSIDWAD